MVRRVCLGVPLTLTVASLPTVGFAEQRLDFDHDVRPFLLGRCAQCHGSGERNGGLSFDDRATLLAEADSGKAPVVAGRPKERLDPNRRILVEHVAKSDHWAFNC